MDLTLRLYAYAVSLLANRSHTSAIAAPLIVRFQQIYLYSILKIDYGSALII